VVWRGLSSVDATKLTPEAIKARSSGDEVGQLSTEDVMHVAAVMFGVILGFMLLIYISRFIEWAIYKAKL
jgi:hypothetical protein